MTQRRQHPSGREGVVPIGETHPAARVPTLGVRQADADRGPQLPVEPFLVEAFRRVEQLATLLGEESP